MSSAKLKPDNESVVNKDKKMLINSIKNKSDKNKTLVIKSYLLVLKQKVKKMIYYSIFLNIFSIINIIIYSTFNSNFTKEKFEISKIQNQTNNELSKIISYIDKEKINNDKYSIYNYTKFFNEFIEAYNLNFTNKNIFLNNFIDYEYLENFVSSIIKLEILFFSFNLTIFIIFIFSVYKFENYARVLNFAISISNGISNFFQVQLFRIYFKIFNYEFMYYFPMANTHLLVQLIWYVFIEDNFYINIISLNSASFIIYFSPLGIELNSTLNIAFFLFMNIPIIIFQFHLFRKEKIRKKKNERIKSEIDAYNNLLENLKMGILTIDKFNNINFNEYIIEKFHLKKLVYTEKEDLIFKMTFFSKLDNYNSKIDKEILKVFEDYGKIFSDILDSNRKNNNFTFSNSLSKTKNFHGSNYNNKIIETISNLNNNDNDINQNDYSSNNKYENHGLKKIRSRNSSKFCKKISFDQKNNQSFNSDNSGLSRKSKGGSLFNKAKKEFNDSSICYIKANDYNININENNHINKAYSSPIFEIVNNNCDIPENDAINSNRIELNKNKFIRNHSIGSINIDSEINKSIISIDVNNNYENPNIVDNFGNENYIKNTNYLINSKGKNYDNNLINPIPKGKPLLLKKNTNNYKSIININNNFNYINQSIEKFLNILRKNTQYNEFALLGRKFIKNSSNVDSIFDSKKNGSYLDYYVRINPISNSIEFLIKDVKNDINYMNLSKNIFENNKLKKNFITTIKNKENHFIKNLNKNNTFDFDGNYCEINYIENINLKEKWDFHTLINDNFIFKSLIEKILIQIKKHISLNISTIADIKRNFDSIQLNAEDKVEVLDYSNNYLKFYLYDLEFLNEYLGTSSNNYSECNNINNEDSNFNQNNFSLNQDYKENSSYINRNNNESQIINSDKNLMDFDDFNLRNSIKKILKIFHRKIKLENKNIKIKLYIQENIPEIIKFDKKKLEHIIFILLDNGIKYSEFGQIYLSIYSSKDNFYVEVTDSGIGISSEEINKIGYLFTKNENSLISPVIGLSLFIIKTIADSFNGNFFYDSILGKGSVFKVSFPNVDYIFQDFKLQINNKNSKNKIDMNKRNLTNLYNSFKKQNNISENNKRNKNSDKFKNKNYMNEIMKNWNNSNENNFEFDSNKLTKTFKTNNTEDEVEFFSYTSNDNKISKKIGENKRIKSFESDILGHNTINYHEEENFSNISGNSLNKRKLLKGSRINEKNFDFKKILILNNNNLQNDFDTEAHKEYLYNLRIISPSNNELYNSQSNNNNSSNLNSCIENEENSTMTEKEIKDVNNIDNFSEFNNKSHEKIVLDNSNDENFCHYKAIKNVNNLKNSFISKKKRSRRALRQKYFEDDYKSSVGINNEMVINHKRKSKKEMRDGNYTNIYKLQNKKNSCLKNVNKKYFTSDSDERNFTKNKYKEKIEILKNSTLNSKFDKINCRIKNERLNESDIKNLSEQIRNENHTRERLIKNNFRPSIKVLAENLEDGIQENYVYNMLSKRSKKQ